MSVHAKLDTIIADINDVQFHHDTSDWEAEDWHRYLMSLKRDIKEVVQDIEQIDDSSMARVM